MATHHVPVCRLAVCLAPGVLGAMQDLSFQIVCMPYKMRLVQAEI